MNVHKAAKLMLLCCIIFNVNNVDAQEQDTLDIYKKIKRSAERHRFTTLLYDAIFVSPVPRQTENKPLSDEQKQQDPNTHYNGKIIREIIISVYDPFGYSVNDTFTRSTNDLQHFGNKVHIKSKKRIIRNILLFNTNDSVEQIRITESERLLRAMNYINDARIRIKSISSNEDSVDIEVTVMDKWSIVGWGGVDNNGGYFRIRDRNLSGLGQTYEQYVGYYQFGQYDYRGNYRIANLKNTFISSNLYYTTTNYETRIGISFDRPFYSPLSKWAGGIEGNRVWGKYYYRDSVEKQATLNFYNYDLWLAKSFQLPPGKNKENNSQIIIGSRYNAIRFLERPSFSIDTGQQNLHYDMVLMNLSYSIRKYYKDMFIYRFGANEDVPEGLLIQATIGVIQNEFSSHRNYAGCEISNGKYFKKLGYLSGYFRYGAIYGGDPGVNSTVNSGASYFSNLYKKNKWYFRHFIYYKLIHGINKTSTETVTFQPDEMYGFNSGSLSGRGKMLLNLEAIAYAPYNLIGFQFAPVLSIGYGIIKTSTKHYNESNVYQAYSMGLLIRNENLLNASFQFSIGYYPELPGGVYNVFKANPIASFSLKLRAFDNLKPEMVAFR